MCTYVDLERKMERKTVLSRCRGNIPFNWVDCRDHRLFIPSSQHLREILTSGTRASSIAEALNRYREPRTPIISSMGMPLRIVLSGFLRVSGPLGTAVQLCKKIQTGNALFFQVNKVSKLCYAQSSHKVERKAILHRSRSAFDSRHASLPGIESHVVSTEVLSVDYSHEPLYIILT
jgi:hypothetical protein